MSKTDARTRAGPRRRPALDGEELQIAAAPLRAGRRGCTDKFPSSPGRGLPLDPSGPGSAILPFVKPKGLRHIALKARDLKATERFYAKMLGLKVLFRSRGMLGLESPGGDDFINFFSTRRSIDPDVGGLDHFGFRFDRSEFARIPKELKDAGVKIVGRRGRSSVYILDPNGYTVELYAD